MANITKPKPKNDFLQGLKNDYGFSSYEEHFRSQYIMFKYISWFLLACSAGFSSKYFAGIVEQFAPSIALPLGVLLSAGLSFLIGRTTHKQLGYYREHKTVDNLLLLIVITCFIYNVYGDLSGADSFAYDIVGTERPTNEATAQISATYEAQIKAIEDEVHGLESANFYWCPVHSEYDGRNRAHKCDDPKNIRVVNRKVKGDREAEARVKKLLAQKDELVAGMNASIQKADAQAERDGAEWDGKLAQAKNITKGGSIACMLLYLVVITWMFNYADRVLADVEESPEEEEFTAEQMKEAEEAVDLLSRDNRQLREEMQALKEALANGIDPGAGKP